MLKYGTLLLLAVCAAGHAAEFEMAYTNGGGWVWRSPDAWYINKGKAAEVFPAEGDDVILKPQHNTSNFYLALQLPTGSPKKDISIKSFNAEIGASVDLQGKGGVESFSVSGDFIKSVEVEKRNGALVAAHDGNLAIAPFDMKSFLHVKLGNVILKNEASDKSAIMAFGGNDAYGIFHTHRLLASFKADKISISNHIVFVATENGVNAEISQITFEGSASGMQGALILNGDNQNEAWQQLQTIKVGGLQSAANGAGIVATKAGSKKIPTKEEARYLPGNFKSDDIIRNGHLEIVGAGGVYSGEIKDNFQKNDTRGKVHITMNSPGGRQILAGKNSYTGNTYIQNGFLEVNVSEPLKKFYLRGGALSLAGENPRISDLYWSSGMLRFDFGRNNTVKISGEITLPVEKKNLFEFSNFAPRKTYILMESETPAEVFNSFKGLKTDFINKADGNAYTAIFGASDFALSVVFIPKTENNAL